MLGCRGPAKFVPCSKTVSVFVKDSGVYLPCLQRILLTTSSILVPDGAFLRGHLEALPKMV